MAHDRAVGRDPISEDEAVETLLKKWGEPSLEQINIDLCLKGAQEAAREAHLDVSPIDTDEEDTA